MIEIKAPNQIPSKYEHPDHIRVFVGGSIDMGKAIDWQKTLTERLQHLDVVFYNPRRDDFDVTQKQSIENPYFYEQVTWELTALEDCDIVVFYFDPKGQAPITLLELGIMSQTDKLVIVCCEDGYYRKGNVDIVCERYGLTSTETLDGLCDVVESQCLELMVI